MMMMLQSRSFLPFRTERVVGGQKEEEEEEEEKEALSNSSSLLFGTPKV